MVTAQTTPPSPIRYLVFDLGGTLMHSSSDWGPVLQRADQALVRSLQNNQVELDAKVFRTRLHEYYEQRDKDFHETTYHLVLRELLKELGHVEVAESVLRSALDALFHITQANWQLESDAVETLATLKSNDYRLGIFSNAGDDKDVQELIESFGIRGYFDFVLTSAACFYRKPHPRAFELSLSQWNATPNEAAMIGDNLEADILGSKQAGMTPIWITRRAEFKDADIRRIQPDYSVRKLPELPPLLDRLSIPHP